MYSFQVFIYCVLFYATLAKKCTTPMGQPGECVPLSSCSSLLWSFANTKDTSKEYLKKFICDSDKGLRVCCRIPKDLLVFENEDDVTEPPDVQHLEKIENMNNCGVHKDLEVEDGIIGSYNFPWVVKVASLLNNTDIEQIICTGVLINDWYVLYTAQCHLLLEPLDPVHVYIRIDSYKGEDAKCQKTSYSAACTKLRLYEIEVKTIHPFYDAETKLNDIAMLRMTRAVVFTEHLRPICLPLYNEKLTIGQLLYTAGWNRTYEMNDTSVKSIYSSSYIISNHECQERLDKDMNNDVITSYGACSVHPRSVNETELINHPSMYLHDNKWYILGFMSKSQNHKSSTLQVQTRLQNYLQWFKEIMGGEQCITPFGETGVITHITYCPRLMDASANLAAEDVEPLNQFVRTYATDDPTDIYYTLKVCCGIAPNFTIFPTKEIEVQYDVMSDYRYCGLQHRDDYILEDDKITVDEFPWLATVINASSPEQRDTICGGSLITHRYVLTSAQYSRTFKEGDTILVRLGDFNLKNASDCTYVATLDTYECTEIQEYWVQKNIWHPFFNFVDFVNDIALLELDKNVQFSDYVRPICLPRSEADFGKDGDTLFVTGFGDSDTGVEGAKIKKKIRTRLMSFEACKDNLSTLGYFTAITQYQVCTEDLANSTDVTCAGDQGGPLMYLYKSRWFIVGITSSYECRGGPPTHLKVLKYLKWIRINMKDNLLRSRHG